MKEWSFFFYTVLFFCVIVAILNKKCLRYLKTKNLKFQKPKRKENKKGEVILLLFRFT